MTIDEQDKNVARVFEGAVKQANTLGVTGFIDPVMTTAEYNPSGMSNLPRDFNRGTGLAIINTLRAFPVRLPSYPLAALPPASAHTGSLVYCPNGAAGSPIVAFSDGSSWLRVDTRTAVS